MATITLTIADSLIFTETVGTNQLIVTFADVLHFSESNSEAIPNHLGITDPVTFSDTVRPNAVRHRTLSDTLPMYDSPYRGPLVHVSDTVNFTQVVALYSFTPHIHDSLTFNETIRFNYGRSISQNLVFTENVKTHFLGQQYIIDSLFFSDSAIASIYTPSYVAPKIPDEPGGPNAILITPTITAQTTVNFAGQSYSLTLRAPDFGNTDSINAIRIQRQTRGGELITYRDPNWSRSETFTLNFSYISDTDALSTQTFINNTLGQLVTYTDYEGNAWTGIVQTPQLEIKKTGRYNNTFTITFEVTQ